jgi:hypothetical protein
MAQMRRVIGHGAADLQKPITTGGCIGWFMGP